jgi:DNA mismatch repair ATPase MutS
MKMSEKYLDLKKEYSSFVVIIKSGIFYITLNEDAKILSYLFDYKVKDNSDSLIVGFPTSSIDKVTNKLEELKLAYVIKKDNETYVSRHNDLTIDKYGKVIIKSGDIYEVDNRIENIINKLNNLKKTNNIINILDKIDDVI